MSQRTVTVTLPDELYQEVIKHRNRSAFVREALRAYVAHSNKCDVASQIRDYCTRESESDRALCLDLDGGNDAGTAAQG
ncbi:MAG: ribbon-helix-helix domain-containing protein [Candidatus Cryosericum sp.]